MTLPPIPLDELTKSDFFADLLRKKPLPSIPRRLERQLEEAAAKPQGSYLNIPILVRPSVEDASLCQPQTATYTVTKRHAQEVALDFASLDSTTAYMLYYKELINNFDKKTLYHMLYSGTFAEDDKGGRNMSRGTGLVYLVNKEGTEYTVTNPLNADDLVRTGWIMLEHLKNEQVCDACKGKGKIEDETCWHCDGYCIDPVKELNDAI